MRLEDRHDTTAERSTRGRESRANFGRMMPVIVEHESPCVHHPDAMAQRVYYLTAHGVIGLDLSYAIDPTLFAAVVTDCSS